MKKMIMALGLLMTSVSANALTLKCVNQGRKLVVTVDEQASTIQVAERGNHTYDFNIDDKTSYEVATGTVVSYSVKNGMDILGSTVSGELAILNDKDVTLEIENDSIGSVRIENMQCK